MSRCIELNLNATQQRVPAQEVRRANDVGINLSWPAVCRLPSLGTVPPMDKTGLQRIGGILREAGQSELLPRFFAQRALGVRQKSSAFDIVTDADEACEAALSAALQRAFRGVVVVGEEGTERQASLLDSIASAPSVFVVDPLDGTKNFASGLPLFGIMVAYLEFGQVVAAAIHDPIRSDTAFALSGAGAWIESAAGACVSLRVADPVAVSQMEAIAGTNFLSEPLRTRVRNNLSRLAMHTWFRCAAHEYRMAAAGHCHVLFYNRLMPWDHAAGWLIHQEAGGHSAHFDGTPYLPSHTTGGLLCAPDELSWLACRAALFDEPVR